MNSIMENFLFIPKHLIPSPNADENRGLGFSSQMSQVTSLFMPMGASLNLIDNKRFFKGVAINNRNLLYSCLFYTLRDQPDLMMDRLRGVPAITNMFEFENVKARLNVNHTRILKSRDEDQEITDVHLIADMAIDFYMYLHHTDVTKGLVKDSEDNLFGQYQGFSTRRHVSHLEMRGISQLLKRNKVVFSDLHWKSFCFNYLGNKNRSNMILMQQSGWLFSLMDQPDQFQTLVELCNDILPVLNSKFCGDNGNKPLFHCTAALTDEEYNNFLSLWGGEPDQQIHNTRHFIICKNNTIDDKRTLTTVTNYVPK